MKEDLDLALVIPVRNRENVIMHTLTGDECELGWSLEY